MKLLLAGLSLLSFVVVGCSTTPTPSPSSEDVSQFIVYFADENEK